VKIVINALSARLGGGQTYLKNLLAHLPAREDLEVHVFAPASLALPRDRRIVPRTTRWPTDNPVLRTLWEVFALPRLLRRERAQVLFCPGGVLATRAPRDCRTATMFRNMIPFDRRTASRIPFGFQRLRNLLLRRTMLRSMRCADRTIFISDYARCVIEGLVPVRAAVTIPHGVSEAFRSADRDLPRPSWLPPGRYVLYVSRFDVYKHQKEVVEGYFSLSSSLRQGLSLVLVGEANEDALRNVSKWSEQSDGCGQVVVAGAIDYSDLPGAYRNATANIFASSCENCPNILLEALGSGRPLLSSSVEPMPEFAAEAAEYFDPFDSASIGLAMRRVLEDGARAKDLGDRAAARGTAFNWSVTASKTWRCLMELARA